MNIITAVLLCMSTPIFAAVLTQPKGWRGIVPLHSTRADVERLIGKPNFNHDLYDFENERVDITYSNDTCTQGSRGMWNVQPDTVISIRVAPKTQLRLSDLQIDESKYKKTDGGHLAYVFYYTNEEEGVQIEEIKGEVANITYFPSAKDNHLRCSVASPLRVQAPTAEHEITYCGHTVSVLDGLGQHTGPNELIIVIASPGSGESRAALNSRRLHNVKAYLTRTYKRSPATIVLAQGERVEGYGRIQIYVDGKLVEELKVKRNADLYVGNCYPEPGQDVCKLETNQYYYPCLGSTKRRR